MLPRNGVQSRLQLRAFSATNIRSSSPGPLAQAITLRALGAAAFRGLWRCYISRPWRWEPEFSTARGSV